MNTEEEQKQIRAEDDLSDTLYEADRDLKREQALAIGPLEAIDNLRVAVKATLLIVPMNDYRVWAQKYLQQTEPMLEGLALLKDKAIDSIVDLQGWQPWTNLGRAKDCWHIIRDILAAVSLWHKGDYHNATMNALNAANQAREVSRRSQEKILGFVRNLEQSLYGEVLS